MRLVELGEPFIVFITTFHCGVNLGYTVD